MAQARESVHPEQTDKTVWEVFEAEQASLIPYPGPFDGFHEVEVAVSKNSLVRFDHNRYSVAVKAARRTAQLRAYADRVVIWCDGEIVGEHPRRFGRGQTTYDPWHYLPVLALRRVAARPTRRPSRPFNRLPDGGGAVPGDEEPRRVRLRGLTG